MEPIWVLQRTATTAHQESLAEHGGPSGIRDVGLLESALARPKNLYAYADPAPTLQQMAAAYAYGITANRPFVDGNRRTALVVSITFLRLNGLVITAEKADRYLMFYRLAAGEISEEQLAGWFEAHTGPLER